MQHHQRPATPTMTPRKAARRAALAASVCCGLLACAALSGLMSRGAASAAPAHAAASPLHYQRGYSVQRGWLCLGYANGAYHCTQHWYRAADGRYVSLNPAWVSSQGSAAPSAQMATTVSYSATVRNTYPFGQCTWGAQALSPHENLSGLGNAGQWFRNAQARGLPTGYSPRVGATVVFAPGVQGASWLGHVGHVVRLGAGGSFLMEAMNDSAGWGRYAYRWVHVGSGVSFIY